MRYSSIETWIIATLLCCFTLPLGARGDGCVIDRLGRYVPEQEQLAFIEWKEGQERLYLATRTDPTDHSSLWIVPVRANPESVQAEPVETAPQVTYYQPLVARAKERLNEALVLTALLDSSLVPCGVLPFVPLGCAAPMGHTDDVREYQRVEKLGMVVVVLTAKSAEALDHYLAANGVNTTAAQLVALAPYLGQQEEYSLICAWLAEGGQKLAARAVRVDFPTPTLFYPLQPTRVYESAVRTVVYVRGLVRPITDLAVPGVECKYLRGAVKEVNLGYSFAPHTRMGGGYLGPPPSDKTLEALTRVEVTSAPALWTSDLILEPGVPAAVEVAQFIDTYRLTPLWGVSMVVGMVLALFLPWAVVPRENRRWTDWLWAAGVGAATGLTVWGSGLVFLAWNSLRLRERTPGQGTGVMGRVLLVVGGSGAAFLLLGGVLSCGCHELPGGIVFYALAALGLLVLTLCLPAFLIYWLARVGGWVRAIWFILFTMAHCGFACLIFFSLREWLSTYE